MANMPEEEASHLLAASYRCIDAPEWMPEKHQGASRIIECGLLDIDDRSSGLYVSFKFSVTSKAAISRYVFTVFKLTQGPAQRVYQIDVTNWPKVPKDVHARPHEHIGDLRVVGDDSWIQWGYDEVMAQFMKRTNIDFSPSIISPTQLRLI